MIPPNNAPIYDELVNAPAKKLSSSYEILNTI